VNRYCSSIGSLCFTLLFTLSANAASVETATSEQKRAAQKVFEAADGLYESGRYEEAAQAFKASHDLVASPNSRLMFARALRELKRLDEACAEYRGTIQDAEASGDRYPEALKSAQAELEALTQSSATIDIKPAPDQHPTEVRLNGRQVEWSLGQQIVAPASKVQLELRFADGTVRQEELELNAGETREIELKQAAETRAEKPAAPSVVKVTPPPPVPESKPRQPRPLRTAAYVSGAVGVAGFAAFGVFGFLNHSTYSNLESKCSNNICSGSQMDDVDKGRRYQLIANIGLGVGAVGTAAAVTLFILSSGQSAQERGTALMLGPGNLSLSGRF
jgi:tetratricopeptide (TPR) repeat protein